MGKSSKTIHLSPFKERLYIFIGCIPMITVMAISFCLLYQDYALNNYNFMGKSWHLSNVEKTSYDVKVSCIEFEYSDLRKKFPSCAPKNCFRYFTDFLISENEGKTLLKMAHKGWLQTDDSDSASFLSVEKGTIINGNSVTKLKENLYSEEELLTYKNVKQSILNHVKTKFGVKNLYLTNENQFTKLSNNNPKSEQSKYWIPKIDKNDREWQQYSVILFLNDFMADFYGSREVFENLNSSMILTIQPKLARVLVYSPGSENKHFFERLEYGISYAIRIPLTCDEKIKSN
ncbi:2-oxoglutarate and iron-dependent oxygenase domain-containing 3-like [Brachionus plicatilis]|uniref:2-oxoglutarate and iron-dependent oxygenase domain-containing 3-like n=1 Tax=Brachionus plicatilis TaxID=10195 RepID=A0A3M7SCE4_BRAPC|nr:2-oxoglutarate and iron-dependent oxygenase domain-containing 3-like [Brachionus plicatilis]